MVKTPARFVITIHGLNRSKFSMMNLHPMLRRNGFKPISFSYFSFRVSIQDAAKKLNDFAKKYVPKGAELNFVTHSLGSIVLRKFALSYNGEAKLFRAVMLGPPNQGSEYARRIAKIPGAAKLLGPSFRELCDLKLAPATDHLEIGIIAGGRSGDRGFSPILKGDNDGAVSIDEADLQGRIDLIRIPAWHSLMMYSSEVQRQIIAFLFNGRFGAG